MKVGDLHFLDWQWLLFVPLLWVFLMWWFKRQRSQQIASIADVDLSAYNHFYHPLADKLIEGRNASSQFSSNRPFWKKTEFWSFGLILTPLIIALAQPVLLGKRLPDPPPERDIVFLVDISLSMRLKDYKLAGEPISRMDLLHNLVDEFAQKMQGEKISVILFAEKPYILVPLSSDQSLIRRMLGRISTSLAGRYTAVGDALLMALNEAKKQNGRHQTFILFTDADPSRGEVSTLAAAEVVGEHGIPVFTIGIGSSQQQAGEKIEGGLYQSVDLALLEDIAKRTGGSSYQVNNADAMQQALEDISKQRKNIAIPKPHYEQHALYLYPLVMALLLLIFWQIYRLTLQTRPMA